MWTAPGAVDASGLEEGCRVCPERPNLTGVTKVFERSDVWEERWHPLREEWVILAAHRQDRPWSGEVASSARRPEQAHDPDCFLCPSNMRVTGAVNPEYEGVFVFDNDRPCVGDEAPAPMPPPAGYESRSARGVARVVCYTPRHDLSLGDLDDAAFDELLRTWQDETEDLGSRPEIEHVLVFENRGDVVGVSSPHPHCQIYATNFCFKTTLDEARFSARHLAETGRVLFQDVIRAELEDGRRLLDTNDTALAFVPYFARWPYEVFVAPREPHESIVSLSPAERGDFARALRGVLRRYDSLWGVPFPYVMVLHQAPSDGPRHPGFHFHAEFHPPLRKPDLRKYLAGPEIGGGNFLNDTSPESTAAELQAVAVAEPT
jgi:UDPglucose--hexose-1-phosphate uridylyltransferase